MAKQPKAPDDTDLRQQGGALDPFDGPRAATNDASEGPHSTSRPAAPGPTLVTATEGSAALARTLRSDARLLALRSTPGGGKSREARQLVAEHDQAGGLALYFVPTHALGAQTVSELAMLGVSASAPMGVPRVRLKVINDQGEQTENSACKHAAAADLLIRSKARIRQDMCPACPEREAYEGQEGSECPAYAAGGDKAPVMVLQHILLASMLREHTTRLLGPPPEKPEDAGATLTIVDEHLPLCTFTDLDGTRAAYKRLGPGEMSETTRRDLEPLLLAVLEGAERAARLGREGATLREIVQMAGLEPGDEDGERRLAWARKADGAAIWSAGLQESLAQRAVKSPGDPDVHDHLKRLARMTALCEAIVDAAFHPDAPALHVTLAGAWQMVTRARWTRYALAYVAAGGRLLWLDATAPVDGLRAVWGEAVTVAAVDVEDAPGVTRRYLRWQRGARRRHVIDGQADPDRLRGPLRLIAEAAAERGARTVAILTDLPTADSLRAWLKVRLELTGKSFQSSDERTGKDGRTIASTAQIAQLPERTVGKDGKSRPAMIPDELAALLDGGVELLIGHYGAQRGLDTWAGADVLVTLGDPWPDLGAARAEALALGLDPNAWARDKARAELLQAWGRARAVHRTTPVLILHLGARVLGPEVSWAPQWGEVEVEVPASHRPVSVRPPSDPSTWKADRDARGMKARQHAAFLGIAWSTYCRLGTAALQRRTVEVPGGTLVAPVETAKKGSDDVAHNWAQRNCEYGSSGGPDAPSLIASYGPAKTPDNPPIDGVVSDLKPTALPPTPRRTVSGSPVTLVPAPAGPAPLAPDAPPSGGPATLARPASATVKGDAA